MEKKSYRILIVTYNYQPHISPRAFRWTAIAEYWAKQGHGVDVVCNRFSKKDVREETRNGVRIFRVTDPMMLLKSVKTIKKDVSRLDREQPVRNFFNAFIKTFYNWTLKQLYWPDYAFLWIFSAFPETRRLLSWGHYDLIISVSYPFSSHVLAFLCTRGLKRNKWIVDIGDPFSFVNETPVNNFKIYGKLNFLAEKKILSEAKVISVTNDKTKELYVKRFSNTDRKIYTIPPLLSFPEVSVRDDFEGKSTSSVMMLFVGTLYSKIRNPEFLLELFRRLTKREKMRNLELHFAGDVHDCADILNRYRELLGERIVYYGIVSRERVFELMKGAQVLVNIDNTTSFQLPSKLVEYMATGKPILNIVQGRTRFTDHLVLSYPNVLHVYSSRAIDERTLSETESFILNRKILKDKEMEKILAPYRIETISEKYLALSDIQ